MGGGLAKLAQAAVAPGKLFKRLDLSLVALHGMPLDPPPASSSLWTAPSHSWQVVGIPLFFLSPLRLPLLWLNLIVLFYFLLFVCG